MAKPTVLVADDHSLVIERVTTLLRSNFEVVGTVNNGSDLITQAQHLQPDVILLDITMPILNGIEAAHALRELGSTAKIVFFTVHDRSAFVQACLDEGAQGYVTKTRLATDLVPAINAALLGELFISPSTLSDSPQPKTQSS